MVSPLIGRWLILKADLDLVDLGFLGCWILDLMLLDFSVLEKQILPELQSYILRFVELGLSPVFASFLCVPVFLMNRESWVTIIKLSNFLLEACVFKAGHVNDF